MFLIKQLYCFFMLLLMFNFFSTILYSQEITGSNNNDADKDLDQRINLNLSDESLETQKILGKDGSKSLYKILIDSFEEFSNWSLQLSNDIAFGRLSIRLGLPSSLDKTQVTNQDIPTGITLRLDNGLYQKSNSSKTFNERKHVLGARINFRKRGHTEIAFNLKRPIYINGLVKNLEVWVSGRQRPFEFYSIIEDVYGNTKNIPMGTLDFAGWKKLTAAIPSTITQYNYIFPDKKGIKFKGFLVRCHPLYTKGTFYIYFDELSVELSRFFEENENIGNPVDTWK